MAKKNILLCVAGGTPAIITETLWGLQAKGERIDEVRVITTLEGRDKILTGKINGRGAVDESLLYPEHGQFFKFQRDYPAASTIKFDENCLYLLMKKKTGVPNPRDDDQDRLTDILTDEDNERAANQICEIVRELAADEKVRIHASIAGGRKTMSLYLMTAMQLFGRNDDAMSHVLVSKEVEVGAPKFFYKPPTPEPILDPSNKPKTKPDGGKLTTADVNIFLAEIPFIRLRGIGAKLAYNKETGYADFVTQAQSELKFLEEASELRLNPKKRTIKIAHREAVLTLREMFVYTMFASFRKNDIGENGFVGFDEVTTYDLEKICSLFVRVEKGENAIDAFRAVQKRADFIDSFVIHEVKGRLLEEKQRDYRRYGWSSPREAKVSLDEASKKVLKSYRETLDRVTEKLVDAKIDSRFDIARKGEKGSYIFGLDLEPGKIKFE